MECAYKFFRKPVLDQITFTEKRFGFEPEVTAKISRLNLRIGCGSGMENLSH